uniref:Inhibitory synaptic factor 1 n=1 Tax=Zosterops lateralis melanops TaxID=1220523 RepID=A0A8D2P3D2_ZOSLA
MEREGTGSGESGDGGGGCGNRGWRMMVIGQLEGILRELKEVAKELREVREQRGLCGSQRREGSDWGWDAFPTVPAPSHPFSEAGKGLQVMGTRGDPIPAEPFGNGLFPKIPSLLPSFPCPKNEEVRKSLFLLSFSTLVLYHALCCDDDGDADDGTEIPDDPARKGPREQLLRNPGTIPIRRATRNSSTQTVADKSTQTLLPYVPARQRIPNKN